MKEQLLAIMHEPNYEPMTVHELSERLQMTDSESFKQLVRELVELEDKYLIKRDRNDRFNIIERFGYKQGIIQVHKKGFGFVRLIHEEGDDIFIPEKAMNGALNRDKVLIRIDHDKRGNREEGEVIRVIERGTTSIVGVYYEDKEVGYVKSDDKRFDPIIVINKNNRNGAMPDHKVKVDIVNYLPNQVEGVVVEILGHKNDPGMDILSVVYKHGIPVVFPPDVMDEATKTKDYIDEADRKGRRDLRDEVIVTMDGADAKDLDDAVTVKRLDNGHYLLGVHIADVSYYVKEGSALDKEAFRRGTSTYLVDRVIPMLPHRLSNGICSLNPGQDRLTMSCEMEINESGEVVKHELFPGVIKTTARMTYHDVNKILVDDDEATKEKYKDLVPMFLMMEELFHILNQKRKDRGAINFETPEAKIIVDEVGKPLDIELRTRDIAEKIIEEFMLVTNATVAEQFHWLNYPFIYRVHEDPNTDKIQRFFQLLGGLGFKVKGTANKIHPKALQEVLEKVKGEAEEAVISTMLLRSMQKARYTNDSLGHYGLATQYYTHFTSPIRRYPDLIVHRLIRKYLFDQNIAVDAFSQQEADLKEVGYFTSFCERRSIDCEREVDSMKKAEYMMDKIGEEYEGIISSVTNWGIYVELPNTVEGLVHVLDMTDDYYVFDERSYALIGERTKKQYRIGDKVQVRVISADKESQEIDFEIVGIKPRKRKKEDVNIEEKKQGNKKKTRQRREKKLRQARKNRK